MQMSLESVLHRDALKNELLSRLKFQSARRLRQASRCLAKVLQPPKVPAELLKDIPTELHIRREMTFSKLAELAMHHSSHAIREIARRVNDQSDKQWLCRWGLETLRSVAECGEAWLLSVILAPCGPLTHSDSKVRSKGLTMLAEFYDSGIQCPDVIPIVAGMLNDCDNAVCGEACQCLVLIVQAAGGPTVTPGAIRLVVEQLCKGRTESSMSYAVCVLRHIVPRGDRDTLAALLQVLQGDKQISVRFFAATAVAWIAEHGDNEVIGALEACATNDSSAPVRAACWSALKRLGHERAEPEPAQPEPA